jgi:hypothetical protein
MKKRVTMSYEKDIEVVESEWSPEDGFFWRIRQGHFTTGEFERALLKLSAISLADDYEIPRRLVSLLWYIPLFMQWQTERVKETGGDVSAYMKAITAMTNEVERLLGVP